MRCPIDAADLVMSERQGVEIDYCPTCRGVWLDRGELDKILDRAANPAPDLVGRTLPNARMDQRSHDEDHERDQGSRREEPHRGDPRRPARKKESWLSDLLG